MKIKQKDINLYTEFQKSRPSAIKSSEHIKLGSLIVLTLVIISAYAITLKLQINSLENSIQSADMKIDNVVNNDEFDSLNDIHSDVDEISDDIQDIETFVEYISLIPQISEKLISEIKSNDNITLKNCSYTAESSSLTIEAKAVSANDITDFIKSLRECGECYDVEYSGYTAVSDGYNFNAVCIIEDKEKGTDENNE